MLQEKFGHQSSLHSFQSSCGHEVHVMHHLSCTFSSKIMHQMHRNWRILPFFPNECWLLQIMNLKEVNWSWSSPCMHMLFSPSFLSGNFEQSSSSGQGTPNLFMSGKHLQRIAHIKSLCNFWLPIGSNWTSFLRKWSWLKWSCNCVIKINALLVRRIS